MWEIIIYNIIFWSALIAVAKLFERSFEYTINNYKD